jgi:ferredoxin
MVKITIDRKDCISCGNCWSVCPKIFEQSKKDSLSQITKKYRLGEELGKGECKEKMDCIKTAESQCPVTIIHVK